MLSTWHCGCHTGLVGQTALRNPGRIVQQSCVHCPVAGRRWDCGADEGDVVFWLGRGSRPRCVRIAWQVALRSEEDPSTGIPVSGACCTALCSLGCFGRSVVIAEPAVHSLVCCELSLYGTATCWHEGAALREGSTRWSDEPVADPSWGGVLQSSDVLQ